MAKRVADSREFVRGAARRGNLVYLISKSRELIERDVPHTSVIGVYKGQWVDGVATAWDSSAIAIAWVPAEKVVAIGEDGDVVTYVGGNSEEECITPPPVMIRNACEIGGQVYACGMKRQVYRRVAERRWVDMSAPRAAEDEKFGFEAIDGYSENEIYAVGWGGEIWRYDGSAWTAVGSPTNVILTAVCCGEDGRVYAAGQGGVLVKGRGDVWEIVAWDDEVTADFWDLCWFRDKLYIATLSVLFTLDGNGLRPVDMGESGSTTFYSITKAEGVLWSVGRGDVASFDGTTWQRYD